MTSSTATSSTVTSSAGISSAAISPSVASALPADFLGRISISKKAPFTKHGSTSVLGRALVASLALGLIAVSLGWWQATQQAPEVVVETITEYVTLEPEIAAFSDSSGQTTWLASVYAPEKRVDIRIAALPEAQPDNDYQLWILGGDGVPVSIGLLPQSGAASLELSDEAQAALASGSTVAVSLEPKGGSPEPTPTGPVLYTASLIGP
ncbi:MAG: anti-sigma factor [Pseudomonadota bacterium]